MNSSPTESHQGPEAGGNAEEWPALEAAGMVTMEPA